LLRRGRDQFDRLWQEGERIPRVMAISISYVINAMDGQVFSVLAPDVRRALDLSLPQVGPVSTGFMLGMGLASLPTGWMLERMTRRNVTLIALIVFSTAALLTAYARGTPGPAAVRFVSGLGEAMQLTAILAIGTTYFLNHRALARSHVRNRRRARVEHRRGDFG
jgi:MFS family permease